MLVLIDNIKDRVWYTCDSQRPESADKRITRRQSQASLSLRYVVRAMSIRRVPYRYSLGQRKKVTAVSWCWILIMFGKHARKSDQKM